MRKIRGKVETINGEHFWYDVKDHPHRLSDMDEQYLMNCIRFLQERRKKEAFKLYDQSLDISLLKDEIRYRVLVRNKTAVGKLVYG